MSQFVATSSTLSHYPTRYLLRRLGLLKQGVTIFIISHMILIRMVEVSLKLGNILWYYSEAMVYTKQRNN